MKPNQTSSRWLARTFPWISALYLTVILGLPSVCALLLVQKAGRFQMLAAVFVLPLWSLAFVVVAGALSRCHQFAVTPGKFRRDVGDRRYFHRRLYGLCWTAVFYNKPVYFICLSIPFLKWVTFRLFGYRGSMNFTVYPDTWIRDLPLLNFEDGVYVSNRATLGTNIVLSNGYLLVDGITLRSGSLVGHLAMVGPGAELEAGVEVGVGAVIGIRANLGAGSFVGPCSGVGHGARLGAKAALGSRVSVGSRAVVPDDLHLPDFTTIAARTRVKESDYRQRPRVVEAMGMAA